MNDKVASPLEDHPQEQKNIAGIRISNLDSADQATTWRNLTSNFFDSSSHESSRLWDASSHTCDYLLSHCTEVSQYFARVLRTAYLTNKVITLTYQEILDGPFSLAFGPEKINQLLGLSFKDSPAIYIRTFSSSHHNLQETLISSFTFESNGHRYINTRFEPSSLVACKDLYSAARSQPQETAELPMNLSSMENCSLLLSQALEKTYLLPHGSLSLLAQRWDEWFKACESGLAVFLRADDTIKSFDFSHQFNEIPNQLKEDEISQLLARDSASVSTNDILSAISQPNRSKAFSSLNSLFNNSSYQNRTPAHNYARDLYQYVYQMALAKQYSCILMTVQDSSSTDDGDALSARLHTNIFTEKYCAYLKLHQEDKHNFASISGETTGTLGSIPASYFSSILYTSRSAIDKWRAAQDEEKTNAARELDYAIKKASTQTDRAAEGKDTLLRGFIAILLAIAGWALDEFQFGGNGGIILSATIALLISVGPEIIDLIKSIHELNEGPQTFFAQF